MFVTVEEMKQYLRVEDDEEDVLIGHFIEAAEKTCMDILRIEDREILSQVENARIAVMYMTAYLFEHREEADYPAMMLTLRSLLSGNRQEGF